MKGSVRSNHWHKTEWHWLYVLEGRMRYREKDRQGHSLRDLYVGPGELVYTPPGRVHRTEFLEDTLLLSLAPKQAKETHEADLQRVVWCWE